MFAIPLSAIIGDLHTGVSLRQAGWFLLPSEVFPSAEVRALRHALNQEDRIPTNDPLAAAVIDPLLQRWRPGLTNQGDPLLHRRVWSTPSADLIPAWREELARLEMRAL